MTGEIKFPRDVPPRPLSEKRLLLLLAAVQFTHVMDFMIMMPLGPQLMRELNISAQQFGFLISAFALTAGAAGLAMAPFADRFDRRNLLLGCYAGFALATVACALSESASALLVARAACGAFGGVAGATIMAIVADVVPPERRARGMGIIMTAFSAAAAIGVPLGLKIAQWWKWEGPFFVIAGVSLGVWIGLLRILPPVRGHLNRPPDKSGHAFLDLLKCGNAWRGLALMMLMIFGHFTIIPLLSPYLVKNVGLAEHNLFLIYLTGGLVTIFTGPLVGRLADRHGRFKIYACLVVGASFVIHFLTTAGPQPLWQTLVLAACFFAFASGRFVPGQATISLAVPRESRGAYMSLVACSRDLAAGITASFGTWVVAEGTDGKLLRFDTLGWITIGVSLASLLVYRQVKSVE